jgi:RNA polymerase sigma factor (sigma-70 family)
MERQMPEVFPLHHPPAEHPRAWLESNVTLVTRTARLAGRRHRLPPQDRPDLVSIFWTHLAKDDYRVLRQFRGPGGIAAYLRTVADRLVLDLRTAMWGKWRPSARARRLGPQAEAYERFVVRDGRPPEEARALVQNTLGRSAAAELLATTGVWRSPRHLVSLDFAKGQRATTADPLGALIDKRRERDGRVVGQRLRQTVGALPADDQQLIRMRHELGLKVSQIAALLGADQKRLYRRYQVIHAQLRSSLAEAGVSARDVVEVTSGEVSCVPRVLRAG